MISKETKAEICSLYISGKSIAQLSREHGYSEASISSWLKKANINIRKTNGRELNLDNARINQLYDSGESTYRIAKMFSCSDETIRKLIVNIRPEEIRNRHNDETKDKISKASKKLWTQQEYVEKVRERTALPEYSKKLSEASKKNKTLSKWCKSELGRKAISERIKAKWTDPEYRIKQSKYFSQRSVLLSAKSREALNNPEKKIAWISKLRISSSRLRDKPGYVSLPQKRIYEYLRLSGIEFFEEGESTRVGDHYVVDCIIPMQQKMKRGLIIEIQGEYWHSLEHVKTKDRQKATYIKNYTNYDLLYLTDLQTKSFEEVSNTLKPYGLAFLQKQCSVKDLSLRPIEPEQARDFISIHHYLERTRIGTYNYGAFLDGQLIWVIAYSFPIRSEVAIKQKIGYNRILEISRMVRIPNLTCKNLNSYLIRKSIDYLPKDIELLVSFADYTEGHTGAVYKATGFSFDGEVEPSYYYKSEYGSYHKKTIWDRAKKFKMNEKDYAESHGLVRIDTSGKARFVLRLPKR